MTAPTPPPAPGAPTGGEPSGQALPATPPAPQGQPTGQAPTTQHPADKTDLSTLPADVQKIISDLRTEAAGHRTAKQTAQQQRDAVLKAFGLAPDGSQAPPDADALTAQLEQYKATAWENAAQAAIVRVAGATGADADLLLDSSTFLDSLEAFVEDDPNTADFRTKIQSHITDFVTKNPRFKAQTTPAGPARSGGEFPGGAGAGAAITEDQLKSMTPEQIAKALDEGKLKHLL
jgi:hypothetical protein